MALLHVRRIVYLNPNRTPTMSTLTVPLPFIRPHHTVRPIRQVKPIVNGTSKWTKSAVDNFTFRMSWLPLLRRRTERNVADQYRPREIGWVSWSRTTFDEGTVVSRAPVKSLRPQDPVRILQPCPPPPHQDPTLVDRAT